MNDLETRIAALEAKDEIRELTARYCHAVTDGDGLAIVDLFCTEGCGTACSADCSPGYWSNSARWPCLDLSPI